MTESRDKTCIDNDGQCLQLSFGSLFTFSLIFIFVVVVVVVVVAVVVCQNWHGLAGCFIYFFFFTEFFLSKNDPFQRGILVSSSIWWGYELVGERRLRKPKRFGTELLKIWQKKNKTKTASTTQALAKAPSPPPGASVRAKGGEKKSKVLFALKKKIAFFCVGHFFF